MSPESPVHEGSVRIFTVNDFNFKLSSHPTDVLVYLGNTDICTVDYERKVSNS